jgi:WD40 repeat protein
MARIIPRERCIATARFLAAAVLACALLSPTVRAQYDESRRDYSSPGLILETGARTGACDVLTFTRDGRHLLAAGDDKVVRNWEFTSKELIASTLPTLRWKMWQEMRGNIYALALSPDPDNRLVAIAGRGIKNSQLAVIDRFTGQVVHAMWNLGPKQKGTIWALAFAPGGKQVAYGADDGTVWTWDLDPQREQPARLLGQHLGPDQRGSKARLVTYLTAGQVASVAQNGQVMLWDLKADQGAGKELFRFSDAAPLSQVVLSPDRKWLAAAVESNRVWLRSFPDGKMAKQIALPPGHFPQRLAFDSKGTRLAVGLRVVDQQADFFRELAPKIFLYDLNQPQPTPVLGPRIGFRIEGLSFHPGGDYLAVAGGDDHEVTLWDLRRLKQGPVSVMHSPGSCLWGVALADGDPFRIGFQDKRDPQFTSPNHRGLGPWRVFDLKKRDWLAAESFRPAAAVETWQGWKVLTSYQKVRRADTWFVQSPERKVYQLDIDSARNGFPQGWTFLPPLAGKPLRLAVGHYLGVSLFELDSRIDATPPADQPWPVLRPRKLLTGHEGEVMALAVDRDQKLLVTASRDQTLAGWSLEDWPCQAELGARFKGLGDKLLVDAVDAGSPAWEAGLSRGDEIALVVTGGSRVVFARSPRFGKTIGFAAAIAKILKEPVPGEEIYLEGPPVVGQGKFRCSQKFGIEFALSPDQKKLTVYRVDRSGLAWQAGLRAGDEITSVSQGQEVVYRRGGPGTPPVGTVSQAHKRLQGPTPGVQYAFSWLRYPAYLTTVRQRPVWRLFPTRAGEWVLWRWRDYYYDTSTNGDFYIGFQENGDDLHETPRFFRAEQFRRLLNDPVRLKDLFQPGGLLRLPAIGPPRDVKVAPAAGAELQPKDQVYLVMDRDPTVTVQAAPRGQGPNDQLRKAILWINDHQFRTWNLQGGAFTQKIEIPRKLLRHGPNEVLLQCYNRGDVRGESLPVRLLYEGPVVKPTLYGVVVGVGDYRRSHPRQKDLKAGQDARQISKLLMSQKDFFADVVVLPPLLDSAVTPKNVLEQLGSLQGQVGPDDILVLHIGGHGARPHDLHEGLKHAQKQMHQELVGARATELPTLKQRLVNLERSAQGLQGLRGFFFCCANFDLERLRETTLSFDDLYEVLVKLPCHKVLLLDTCHSGDVEQYGVKNNPIRTLTPDGMGPIILAACKPDQNAWEHGLIDRQMFGVFAAALRRTLQEDFARADQDKSGTLDARELYEGIRSQVHRMMRLVQRPQEPILFLPRLEERLKLFHR